MVGKEMVMARRFADLSEQEILALAISNEEEDSRIYGDIDFALRSDYPATAKVFEGMEAEEQEHRRGLTEMYRSRFGEHIPVIWREAVKGFIRHKRVWLVRPLGIEAVRKLAETMELETRRFYERAAQRTTDAATRKLLGDLAEAEAKHSALAEELEKEHLTAEAKEGEAESER